MTLYAARNMVDCAKETSAWNKNGLTMDMAHFGENLPATLSPLDSSETAAENGDSLKKMELEHWVPTLLGFNGQHRIADGQSKARLLEFPTHPAFHLTNIDVVFFALYGWTTGCQLRPFVVPLPWPKRVATIVLTSSPVWRPVWAPVARPVSRKPQK